MNICYTDRAVKINQGRIQCRVWGLAVLAVTGKPEW